MAFDTGYQAGLLDERKRHEQREQQLRRLVDAADAAEQGDMSLLDEFVDGDGPELRNGVRNSEAGDDLLDVADTAGVTPLADAGFVDELVPEIEAWLRDQH